MTEVIRWINAQNQNIKLQFKFKPNEFYGIRSNDYEKMTELLNNNKIIEFEEKNIPTGTNLSDAFYK